MRLVLEKGDLIRVLERHFGETFDDSKVIVRADPFEVELVGLPLTMEAAEPPAKKTAPKKPAVAAYRDDGDFDGPTKVTPPDLEPEDEGVLALRAERNVSTDPPPYSPEEEGSPASVVNSSKRLEDELGSERE